MPLYIWDKMKKHQKAGLKWLWNQVLGNSGGILGNGPKNATKKRPRSYVIEASAIVTAIREYNIF